ncbi:hypothetical protein GJ744_008776 [Endocarpon pusillum]|uniref:Uncharacterized protein n=1 Tax=Endocarpon pusillum TaxID=364733 RepID=A0A8H7ASG0_9EURO|nr:hypothetical protein GJ744_008776 [Endocarpon pusillum]
MLQDGRRRRVSTANDSQQAGRQRRQTLSQLHNQPRGASEDKNHPTDDNSESIPTDVEPRKMSLSALRFVPTSVLRKQNQKGRPPNSST